MIDRNDGSAEERQSGYTQEDEFERELRASLRPRPAPEGFVERAMRRQHLAAVGGPDFRRSRFPRSRRPLRFPHAAAWLRWSAAACLLLTAAGGLLQHEYERREAGKRARQQVLLALRITSATLEDVRNKVDNPRLNRTTEREP